LTIAVSFPEIVRRMASLVYNKNLPFMLVKSSHGVDSIHVNMDKYRENHTPKMDESVVLFCKETFTIMDEEHSVVCQMIRSFVPNMSAVVKQTKPTKHGS